MKLKNLTKHLITINAPQEVASDYVKPGQAYDLMPAGEAVEVPDELFSGDSGFKIKGYVNNLITAGMVQVVTGEQPASIDAALEKTDYSSMKPDDLRKILDKMGVEHRPQYNAEKLIKLIRENS